MNHLSDAVLAKKIRRGNGKAFKAMYDRYHRQLFYLAMKYVKEQQLAEDAIQDIFVKLWEKRDTLNLSGSIKGYLFTMLKNHLLNTIRNRKKTILSTFLPDEENLPHNNQTEDEVAYAEYMHMVKCSLGELTEGQREVFEMRVFKGLSNAQVADQLLVSIHTVKSQFYHGCKYIRNYLEEHSGISS